MIEASIGPIALLLTALPLGLLALLVWVAWRQGRGLHLMVLGLTMFHQAALVTFPMFYDVFTSLLLEKEMVVPVDLALLGRVMLGECAYVSAFVVPMFWSMHRRRCQSSPASSAIRAERWLAWTLLGLGLVLYAIQFFSTPVIEYESYQHFAEVKVQVNVLSLVGAWIKGAFALPCLFAACLLIADSRNGWAMRAGSLGIIALMLLFGIATGYRGRITWVISLLLVGAIIHRNRLVLWGGIGLLAGTAVLAPFMGGMWRSISINDLAGQSQWTALGRLAREVSSGDSLQEGTQDFVKVLARRAQGPRNSAVLYLLHDGGKGAGAKPIVSAFQTVVPRSLWPAKGIGGSSDDTPYGAAIFLVRFIGYEAPLFNMGPVLASAHAYWEGGWPWVIIGGMVAGIFWVTVLSLAYRLPPLVGRIVCLCYASSLLIDGLFTMLNPLYSFILATINSVFFVYAVYVVIRLAYRLRVTAASVCPPHDELSAGLVQQLRPVSPDGFGLPGGDKTGGGKKE